MLWNPLEFVPDPEQTAICRERLIDLAQQTSEVCKHFDVPISREPAKVLGREVGDDRYDNCQNASPLCCALVVQEEVLQMKTSPEDTGICKTSWNFCEVTSGIPTDPSEGYDASRKTGFENIGFNDSIIFRIITDVRKGMGDEHSSTEPGKMSLLGARLRTPRKEVRPFWMIASLFQDAMLSSHKAPEPKYLPQQMGGTGVQALFDNPNNLYLSCYSYRGGRYQRIYASATQELRSCLSQLETHGEWQAPVLCPRLREKQEYFHGTYDHEIFVPNPSPIDGRFGSPEPLYTATGGANRFQATENRLLRSRIVLTRRGASIAWAHAQRLRLIFNGTFSSIEESEGIRKDLRMTARARYDGALTANAALANLLARTAGPSDAESLRQSKEFLTVTSGRREFTRGDAEWLFLNGQGEVYSLSDVSFSQDVFLREEVSEEETFKVEGIPLNVVSSLGIKAQRTVTNIGLYQINDSMLEWCENHIENLKKHRASLGRPLNAKEVGPIFNMNREWVNDDAGIIAKCLNMFSNGRIRQKICLVSDDKRLANQIAQTCNLVVYRASPKDYVLYCRSIGVEPRDRAGGNHPSINECAYTFIDTGSIASAKAKMEYDPELRMILNRKVLRTWCERGTRRSVVEYTTTDCARVRTRTHHPVTLPRYWRQGSLPTESVYSSEVSKRDWRLNTGTASSSFGRTSRKTLSRYRASGTGSQSYF
eukprot:gb/GEZJ01001053.1/.p1 GENE.gb/GEZJ01001053.1/~~gb/GEZJ01001053.1/.p1  ORF type:complete len:709 (-),score=17.24 gb/GEZJ01001053.1/:103-2229(-)